MTSDYKSPYRESGIDAHSVTARPKRIAQPHGFSGVARRYRQGHIWNEAFGNGGPSVRAAKSAKSARVVTCRRCGRPRFAVESARCRGFATFGSFVLAIGLYIAVYLAKWAAAGFLVVGG